MENNQVIEKQTIIKEVPVEKIIEKEVEVEVIKEIGVNAKLDNANKVAEALVKFNSEMENIEKNAKNPFFKSSYLDLSAITNTVRPILAKHGLSMIQYPINDSEGRVSVNTVLLHESGERMEFPGIFVRPSKAGDPQIVGSIISYLKRYSASAILFISGKDEDDDGNAASQPQTTQQTSAPRTGGRI